MNGENLDVYNSAQVVNWYTELKSLVPAETLIFERYAALLKSGNVLDIGIGGGRTTAYLIDRCKSYTGIDYSEGFIQAVKKKFPAANLLLKDARDLSSFERATFDVVNFSFNGMDYVDLEGRKKIFSEIFRVLKPGGLFFFSTHNKDHESFGKAPWQADVSLFINLKTFIKLLPFLLRKIRHKKRELIHEEYAIINDSAHNYSLMTFYTSLAFLRKQLAIAGFEEAEFYNRQGEKKADMQLEEWIFATAQKINF